MFGAYIRAAIGFVGLMVLASVLQIVVGNSLLPVLADSVGKTNPIYRGLNGVVTWAPVIGFVTIIFALIARSVTESKLPG